MDTPVPSWQTREQLLLAPYATFGKNSQGRTHHEPVHPYRSPYQRDRDRILHSAAFRRLSGKMQVFTGDMGDYHRTRLTHTHEVASIARTIGRLLQLNEDLIEALALLHDIGHPPFGHCGEDALDACLTNHGGFSHNQFAMDLAERLEQRYTPYPGLNLTAEVLAGQTFRANKHGMTTPSLEMQVVDAADSIAYDAHDVDDALKLDLLQWRQLAGLPLVERALRKANQTHSSERTQRQVLVHSLIDLQVQDFLERSISLLAEADGLDSQAICEVGLRLQLSDTIEQEKSQLEKFLFENVYRHPRLIDMRSRASTRMTQLFKLLEVHPERLPLRFQNLAATQGVPRTVGQYLAGMTDRFCDDQYTRLVELGRDQGDDWN
jgi:dGTPase